MTLFRPVGLTLLEVVVILALLSVLAISALPAFYAYRYRAHVSAALEKATVLVKLVEDNAKKNRAFDAGLNPAWKRSAGFDYQVDAKTGQITLTAVAYYSTPTDAVGKTIILQPFCQQKISEGVFMTLSRQTPCISSIQWQEAVYKAVDTVEGSTLLHGVQGTMPSRYVPAFTLP